MKRLTSIVCFVLICTLLISVPAFATEQDQRASNYFSAYKAYCYEKSSTELGIYFSVVGVGPMDELGASVVKVQRSSNGTDWETVKTFTRSSDASLTDTHTGFHAASLSCAKTSGYYYRAYVAFYARNSAGTGNLYYYTARI